MCIFTVRLYELIIRGHSEMKPAAAAQSAVIFRSADRDRPYELSQIQDTTYHMFCYARRGPVMYIGTYLMILRLCTANVSIFGHYL